MYVMVCIDTKYCPLTLLVIRPPSGSSASDASSDPKMRRRRLTRQRRNKRMAPSRWILQRSRGVQRCPDRYPGYPPNQPSAGR